MAVSRGNLQQLMMDSAVATSVKMTAQMLGISEDAVVKILQVGLPMMAKMADENPALLKALYGQSVQMLPEPMQAFYAKLADNPASQQKMLDEFKTMVGPMMDSLQREAASGSGASEVAAGKALATTYPAVAQALAKDSAEQSEAGFARRLKDLLA